jgi:glycosyltransferase involved in cell wall biosynthesis
VRIAIDASRAARPNPTGTERYSRELLRHFVPLARRHDVSLYYDREPPERLPGATTRVVPLRRLWTHGRLSLEMLRDRPDALFVPSHVVPLAHPRATVVTIHDLGYLRYRLAYSFGSWVYLVLSTLWSARVARQVVVDSWATKRDLERHAGVDPAKLHVVHLGVDALFRPIARPTRDYLLFVGTLQPRKNLPRLLRAYELASREAPMPELRIAGNLGHGADRLRLPAGARYVGYAPPEALPGLYANARAFVFPSLFEGFGIPLLEAMASGTPVLAGNNSSMPEVVGDAGVLVDATDERAIADGLVRLLDDDSLRDRGIARAAQFTWERTARETLAVIERAAG